MTRVDQWQIGHADVRDRPLAPNLVSILERAAVVAGIDTVHVFSGGQPGTRGKSTGSHRHDGGRAADLDLIVAGQKLRFTDTAAPERVVAFVQECARLGANGIGGSVEYMGPTSLHIGFGQTPDDKSLDYWGGKEKDGAHAPEWLKAACVRGWQGRAPAAVAPATPPPLPRPKPAPASPLPTVEEIIATATPVVTAGVALGWIAAGVALVIAIAVVIFIRRANKG